MFIDFIYQFIETLVNTQAAEIFSAPFAMFLVLILVFLLFTMFSDGRTKRVVLTCILIITLVFIVFSMASNMGFITIPITFGG